MVKTFEFKKGYLAIEIHSFKVSVHWTSKKRLNFINWCFENDRLDLLELQKFI